MAKKQKERLSVYPFVLIVALLIIVLVYIYNPQNTEKQSITEVTGMVVKNLEEENVVEEKNIAGSVVKLDECLQDCQYKVCKEKCGLGNIIESECFRRCLDECNNKCLEVYG